MEYFKKLLFIATSEEEAQPLIDLFTMVPLDDDIDPGLPAMWYVAIQAKVKLYLLVSGEIKHYGITRCGTVNASLLAWEGIRTLDPDFVISCGYATGLANDAEIGDLFLCNTAQYYDRQFHCDEGDENQELMAYALGNYSCVVPAEVSFNYKLGVISSGNNCHISQETMDFFEENKVSLIDISTAAIAEICDLRYKPLIVIKGVHQLISEEEDDNDVLQIEDAQMLDEKIKIALEEIVTWAVTKLIPPMNKKVQDAKHFKAFSFRRFKKDIK
ncbi:hypothetical protein L3V86_06085 [Thiotrichales bacterium 19S11-10]|nr:hypothetical protein [Thiotrichales bacterium 19S11-10]MCF6807969.1 hypothetical protein [Thiotrichales bacterium 19S9-11]MCF6811984.1 hypothetical protein [Thiotrichales bacterium 19S9-12]